MLAVNAVGHPGGAEIGLQRLVARLRGWDVSIAGPGELPVGGLARGQGAPALRSFPKARRLARHADVVYLNGTVAGRLLPAVRAAPRTVLHVHDLVEHVPRHWRQADVVLADSEAVADRPLPRPGPQADVVLADSEAVADRLEGLDAHVVGCPVELDVEARAASPFGGGTVIGYVGRIEPRKGVLDLVRAAPAIRAARPD